MLSLRWLGRVRPIGGIARAGRAPASVAYPAANGPGRSRQQLTPRQLVAWFVSAIEVGKQFVDFTVQESTRDVEMAALVRMDRNVGTGRLRFGVEIIGGLVPFLGRGSRALPRFAGATACRA